MIRALAATGKPAFVFVSSSVTPRDKNPLESKDKVAHLRKMFPAADYPNLTFVDTKTCLPNPQPPASAAPAPSAPAAASSSASAAAAAANAAADAPLKCGGPIGGYRYLVNEGYTKLTLVGGSDRETDFGPAAPLWNSIKDAGGEPPAFQALARDASNTSVSPAEATMSGTTARALALRGDLERFRGAVKTGSVTNEDADVLYNLLRRRIPQETAPVPPPPKKRPSIEAPAPASEGVQTRSSKRRKGGDDPDEGPGEDQNTSMFDADNEPVGGRHRRTRRRKSRFMRKKRISIHTRRL